MIGANWKAESRAELGGTLTYIIQMTRTVSNTIDTDLYFPPYSPPLTTILTPHQHNVKNTLPNRIYL